MLPCLLALALLAAPVDPPDVGAPVEPPDGGAVIVPPGAQLAPGPAGRVPIPLPKRAAHARHVDWLVVPLVSYNSDTKLALGAAGQVQWTGATKPYSAQLGVQVLFTTGGQQGHWIRYDAPSFLGTPLRVWARAEYYRERYAPWYGVGNHTSDDPLDHPGVGGHEAFDYDRIVPIGRLGASYPIAGSAFRVFAFATFKNVIVHVYPHSLLASEQPYGIAGGHELELSAGVYYDTRDNEAVPSRGWYLSLSGRAAGPLSTYTFGGATARMLHFAPLAPWLVLANRVEADFLTAGAPFFELPNFGDIDAIDGVGGLVSERGVPQDRYVGRVKAIATAELRARFAHGTVRGGPLSFGGVVFLDLGRVWQPGLFDSRPGLEVHPGYGVGLRLWRRAFVLRADLASSPDRLLNLYLVFGHFF